MTPQKALLHPHRKDYKSLGAYFDKIDGREKRLELNLYITGYDEDLDGAETKPDAAAAGAGDGGQTGPERGQPGMSPEESPSR
jgi:hypothetical protein